MASEIEFGKYIDPADEYEQVAEYVAAQYGRPIDANMIRALLNAPAHVVESVECDPQEWSARVNAYCMARSYA